MATAIHNNHNHNHNLYAVDLPTTATTAAPMPRSCSGDVASLLDSPARKRPSKHANKSPKKASALSAEASDDESASSVQGPNGTPLREPKTAKSSKKEHKDKEPKKKKSLRQTHDGLAQRRSPKKQISSDSEDDEAAHRRTPVKSKKERRSPNPKSPLREGEKKGHKSPPSAASDDESDAEDKRERKATKKQRRSHDTKKHKQTTPTGTKHSVTVTSSSKRPLRTSSRDVSLQRRRDSETASNTSSSSDSEGTTSKSRGRRSESPTSGSESESMSSDGERGHRRARRRKGTHSARAESRSRSASRGSSQERKGDNTIRRPPSRQSRLASSSDSSEGTPDTELTSPKGEEIGRMHKEIETLKNLTKILEEKLEILEHIPDDAPDSGSAYSAHLSPSGHHGRKSLTGSTASGGSSRLSDSSDGGESSRKKIKPRHVASTPLPSSKRGDYAGPSDVSRSTADFTKHSRTQMEKAAKRQRRAAHRKHTRSHGGSDSDATNENGGDSSSGTDDEASSPVNGESRKLRKSISLTELRGMPSQHSESEVGKIKKERDHENKVMKQRAVRERARGHREHERQRVGGGSVPYVSPFGNSPATKSLEYCYSCLMKTDISSDGDRKLWKRRVLGFGSNGMNLIKPYTEKVEQVWAWPTIQQWIINDEQNLIKFMIEEDAKHHYRSSDSEHSSSDSEQDDAAAAKSKIAIYTFRVDDANKVNDALWKVVKRVQKKRRGLERLGGGTRSRSSTQSSARNSDNESNSDSGSADDDHHHHHDHHKDGHHHHHFKESMTSLFKALTHSLSGHGHGHGKEREKEHRDKEHRDKDNKERK